MNPVPALLTRRRPTRDPSPGTPASDVGWRGVCGVGSGPSPVRAKAEAAPTCLPPRRRAPALRSGQGRSSGAVTVATAASAARFNTSSTSARTGAWAWDSSIRSPAAHRPTRNPATPGALPAPGSHRPKPPTLGLGPGRPDPSTSSAGNWRRARNPGARSPQPCAPGPARGRECPGPTPARATPVAHGSRRRVSARHRRARSTKDALSHGPRPPATGGGATGGPRTRPRAEGRLAAPEGSPTHKRPSSSARGLATPRT